jgi:hypothetical protein
MEALVVMTQFFHVKAGLIAEVALEHQFPGEVVIPDKRPDITRGAERLGSMMICVYHPVSPS